MNKHNFLSDYNEGCHPNILKALEKTNFVSQYGYGKDSYSEDAKEILKHKLNNFDVDIFFISGGTLTNLIVASSILKPYESIITARQSHVVNNEAGAIEMTGHKLHEIDTSDGKITKHDIQFILNNHQSYPHNVIPKVVFLSNATEMGSIYNKEELKQLYLFCRENDLLLFLDGARLGNALSNRESGLTLEDISNHTDIFYIGGTKNGALIGEAVVICNNRLKQDFVVGVKQRGALLAKGRLLGIQFLELFKSDLFFDLARHANQMSTKIYYSLKSSNYSFLVEPGSNILLPIVPGQLVKELEEKYAFYRWQCIDEENVAIRLVTSWATQEKVVDKLLQDITKRCA